MYQKVSLSPITIKADFLLVVSRNVPISRLEGFENVIARNYTGVGMIRPLPPHASLDNGPITYRCSIKRRICEGILHTGKGQEEPSVRQHWPKR